MVHCIVDTNWFTTLEVLERLACGLRRRCSRNRWRAWLACAPGDGGARGGADWLRWITALGSLLAQALRQAARLRTCPKDSREEWWKEWCLNRATGKW